MARTTLDEIVNDIKSLHRKYVLLLIPLHAICFIILSLKAIYATDIAAFAKLGSIMIASSLAVLGLFRWQTEKTIGLVNDSIRISQSAIHMESHAKLVNTVSELVKLTTGKEINAITTESNGERDLESALKARNLFANTAKTLWLAELTFVATGTIITGYGTDFVIWLHAR